MTNLLLLVLAAGQTGHVQRAQSILPHAILGALESCVDRESGHVCRFEGYSFSFSPRGVLTTLDNRRAVSGQPVRSIGQTSDVARQFLERIAPEGYVPRMSFSRESAEGDQFVSTWALKANPEISYDPIFHDGVTVSRVDGSIVRFDGFGRLPPPVDPRRLRNLRSDAELSAVGWKMVAQFSQLKRPVYWVETKTFEVPSFHLLGRHAMMQKHFDDFQALRHSVFYQIHLIGYDEHWNYIIDIFWVDAVTALPIGCHTLNMGPTSGQFKENKIPRCLGKWSASPMGKAHDLQATTIVPTEATRLTLWNGKQAVPVEFDGKQGLVRWPDGQVFEVPAQLSRDLQKVKPLKIRWSEAKPPAKN